MPYSVGVDIYKATAGDREGQEHVARDQVTIVSPVLWRYTELTYTVHMLSILYTVYSIMTVALNLAIIYAMALRYLYFIFNAFIS